ncbi:hypothetical protein V6N13_142742 [Hibiscus sabdariffa]|uniref:F-box domain-containing protein n=1 Tax=Hibiscus sabdariffa TaxID=183260 RepID=A0ABR2FF59_9ROSI
MASCVDRRRSSSQHPQPSSLPPPKTPSSTPAMPSLELLPANVVYNILSTLSSADAARSGRTCSSWNQISQACQGQAFSKRTLSITRRHDSRYYQRQNDEPSKMKANTCSINKRASKGG